MNTNTVNMDWARADHYETLDGRDEEGEKAFDSLPRKWSMDTLQHLEIESNLSENGLVIRYECNNESKHTDEATQKEITRNEGGRWIAFAPTNEHFRNMSETERGRFILDVERYFQTFAPHTALFFTSLLFNTITGDLAHGKDEDHRLYLLDNFLKGAEAFARDLLNIPVRGRPRIWNENSLRQAVTEAVKSIHAAHPEKRITIKDVWLQMQTDNEAIAPKSDVALKKLLSEYRIDFIGIKRSVSAKQTQKKRKSD